MENKETVMPEQKNKESQMVEAKPYTCKRRRKSPGGETIFKDGVVMEETIWKNFPEELFDRVIARLPATSFFRFRTVCHSWNSVLTSPTFPQLCAEAPPQHPWFYVPTDGDSSNCAMYDHLANKWHHLSLPIFETIIMPVASAGGLICFFSVLEHNHGMLICNPLTHSFRVLPISKLRAGPDVTTGMVFNYASNSYKLVSLCSNGQYEMYDSLEDKWNTPSEIPPHITLPTASNQKSQPISHNGSLYFLRENPDGLVSFDLAKGTWKQKSIPLPQYSTGHCLSVCKECIFLVGLLSKNGAMCVCVWELQKMTYLWKEVDRIPKKMFIDFYGKSVQMRCVGGKGLVFLSLLSRKLNRLVLYDLSKRIWSNVPNCVLPCRRIRQWITSGISFEPSLIKV